VTRESAGNHKQGKANITLLIASRIDLACNADLVGPAFRTGSKLGGKNAHL
jgi:hypothetical protein